MPNEFRICDECRMTNIKTLVAKLKKVDPEADVKIGCQSYCGVGYKKQFCIVNGKHVTSTVSEDDLVEKVEKMVKRAARRQPTS